MASVTGPVGSGTCSLLFEGTGTGWSFVVARTATPADRFTVTMLDRRSLASGTAVSVEWTWVAGGGVAVNAQLLLERVSS